MVKYEDINQAANDIFFDGRFQGLPVYLDFDNDVTAEIAEKLGEDQKDISKLLSLNVSKKLQWEKSNIYNSFRKDFQFWYKKDFGSPPPFTALLLTLSLAAERMREGGGYSANNYYQRLGEVLEANEEHKINRLRLSGKHTLVFWEALNFWLIDNDYDYGKPTAKKLNNWSYVSRALSQSLIREADRKKFHEMFLHYGISPSDSFTESEIILYLDEWMHGHGPSQWLKRLWSVPDLRERIASAAITELESWDISSTFASGKNDPINKQFGWLIVIKTFPATKLNLFLGVGAINANDSIELELCNDSPELAQRGFRDTKKIFLSPLQGTSMVCLQPTDKLKINAFLLTNFTLKAKDNNINLSHSPRPIIPFVKVESQPLYREVSRISLNLKHIILCHNNWESRVSNFLNKYSRPGFRVIPGNGDNGLPYQWTIITNVEIIMVPNENIENNLQCLVPIAAGANIQPTGGLRLSVGIWHADAPPEIIASIDSGILDIKLNIEKIGSKPKTLHEERSELFNPGFLSKLIERNVDLAGKNFTVVALQNNREKAQKQISFRSADIPRRFVPSRDHNLGYMLLNLQEHPKGFSAKEVNESELNNGLLQGMCFDSIAIEEADNSFVGYNNGCLTISHETENLWHQYETEEIQGAAESCILRGYHIWQCDSCGDSARARYNVSRIMTCKDCGSFQVAKKRRNKRERRARGNINHPSSINIRKSSEDRVEADTVYDALCYSGSGGWGNLESILSSHVELPWLVQEFAKNLVDLGFIDVQLSDDNTRPRYWSCSPPALVIPDDCHAYVTGFRNKSLIHDLQEKIDAVATSSFFHQREMAPSLYRWKINGLDIDTINDLLGGIKDPFGRALKVVRSPAEFILKNMPLIEEIKSWLQPIYIDKGDEVERFDTLRGRWFKTSLDKAGAYRTLFAGKRYFYLDENGKTYQAGHELVKLMAARNEKIYLHGYDRGNSMFQCVIGCAPPGLYRRALVSLSGLLPKIEDGKLLYQAIPEKFASLLMYKLYK
jgi:hypothetical protein